MSGSVQGTKEWFDDRRGKVTASRVPDLIARTKSGFSASRESYKAELVLEILTGNTVEKFITDSMKWGTEKEPEARSKYAETTFEPVVEVGFIDHPVLSGAGCSPDGLVGDDGLIEIKCPNTATFIEILLRDEVPQKWQTQIQMQLDCTGRKWCDFVCYDPRMPEGAQMYVKRIERDEMFISTMREMIEVFIKELNETVEKIRAKIQEKQNVASVSN